MSTERKFKHNTIETYSEDYLHYLIEYHKKRIESSINMIEQYTEELFQRKQHSEAVNPQSL